MSENNLNELKNHRPNKRCKECKEIKPIEEFPSYASRPGYVHKTCKICHNKNIAIIRKKWPCYQPEKKRIYDKINRNRHPEKWIWKRAKTRAKQKNISFNLEISDIIIPKFCPVLGIELKPGENMKVDSSPSLDRIIPELGYVKGNIAVISLKANQLKSNGTIAEHEKLLVWMKQNKCK